MADLDTICARASTVYDAQGQLAVLAEEASELAVAAHHVCRRREGATLSLIEEMADVRIMMRQAELILGIDHADVEKAMDRKLARLEQRLDAREAKHG